MLSRDGQISLENGLSAAVFNNFIREEVRTNSTESMTPGAPLQGLRCCLPKDAGFKDPRLSLHPGRHDRVRGGHGAGDVLHPAGNLRGKMLGETFCLFTPTGCWSLLFKMKHFRCDCLSVEAVY